MTDQEITEMAKQAHLRFSNFIKHKDHEWLAENTYLPPRDCTISQLVHSICNALICAMRQERFDPVADALVLLNILEEIPVFSGLRGDALRSFATGIGRESKKRREGSA